MARTLRASISLASTQYSATDCALPPGTLATITPRALASAIGTRAVPVPCTTTARKRGAAAMRASGSLLREMVHPAAQARRRGGRGAAAGGRGVAGRPAGAGADAVG